MFTLAMRTVHNLKNHQNPKASYRWASLFADFLSANSLIHMVKMTIFQSKVDFLSANSRFWVKNGGTYLEGNLYLITKFLFLF
jgi:hypothetical protein